jgi:cell wall-associated NlpC family hydrolase
MGRRMSRFAHRVLVLAVLAGALAPAHGAAASGSFGDVPTSYWDYSAIMYVGQTNTWMQDYGSSTFKPTTLELRKQYAKALVLAYAPNEPTDPNIKFPDLPTSDPFYRYANVAVKLGWMPKWASGYWGPGKAVKTDAVDRAIVTAMGQFSSQIKGLAGIHQADGTKYSVSPYFPYVTLAHYLSLHYNHSDESLDLDLTTSVKRDEIAYTLWMSKNVASWKVYDSVMFNSVSLATVTGDKKDLTAYALNQMGFPYIYGGEWNKVTPTGYCCGAQPTGGMDCSGFVWWVIKKNEYGYDAAQYHASTYAGWSLLDRSSSQMAQYTPTHIGFSSLQPGDLMFFASNGGSTYADVDHVALYLGNNWIIHSASSNDGVVMDQVGSGYYYDTFVYGRRVIGVSGAAAPHAVDVTAGDSR